MKEIMWWRVAHPLIHFQFLKKKEKDKNLYVKFLNSIRRNQNLQISRYNFKKRMEKIKQIQNSLQLKKIQQLQEQKKLFEK
jgi:hypothetical protein